MGRITEMVKGSTAYQVVNGMLAEIQTQMDGASEMSDHDLSPDQYAASVGLSAETLERAAEAIYSTYETITTPPKDDWGNVVELSAASMVRAALPVLVPAIERAVLERILTDFHPETGIFGKSKNARSYRRLIEMYLPAADEQGAPR